MVTPAGGGSTPKHVENKQKAAKGDLSRRAMEAIELTKDVAEAILEEAKAVPGAYPNYFKGKRIERQRSSKADLAAQPVFRKFLTVGGYAAKRPG